MEMLMKFMDTDKDTFFTVLSIYNQIRNIRDEIAIRLALEQIFFRRVLQ